MRHDDPDAYEIVGPPPLPAAAPDVIRALAPLVTPERMQRIETVARGRTDAVVPVLDGLSDPHNASAILRSAEAFGTQHVTVVRGAYGFRAARTVEKGSSRWLDLAIFDEPAEAADALLGRGYELYVAVMDGEHTPHTLGDRVAGGARVAIAFGNERFGVSEAMRERATGSYRIPMAGFVESLNVSVAAAATLYTVASRAPRLADEHAVEALVARYLMHSVRDAETVVREALA